MTKYILHGGATRVKSQSNSDFFIELTKDLDERKTILICLHSKIRERWDEVFESLKVRIIEESGKNDLNIIMGSDDTEALTTQLKDASLIYLHGGDTPKLQKALAQIPNLKELFQNKIIAGSSAGVYVLSKYYYTEDYDTCNEGLNVLPIKSICHYSEERSNKLEGLKNFGEGIEVVTLEEGKFIIINI